MPQQWDWQADQVCPEGRALAQDAIFLVPFWERGGPTDTADATQCVAHEYVNGIAGLAEGPVASTDGVDRPHYDQDFGHMLTLLGDSGVWPNGQGRSLRNSTYGWHVGEHGIHTEKGSGTPAQPRIRFADFTPFGVDDSHPLSWFFVALSTEGSTEGATNTVASLIGHDAGVYGADRMWTIAPTNNASFGPLGWGVNIADHSFRGGASQWVYNDDMRGHIRSYCVTYNGQGNSETAGDAANWECYLDGEQATTIDTGGDYPGGDITNTDSTFLFEGPSAIYNWPGYMWLAVIFRCTLPPQSVLRLARDPWCLLRPNRSKKIWAPPTVAVGPTPGQFLRTPFNPLLRM